MIRVNSESCLQRLIEQMAKLELQNVTKTFSGEVRAVAPTNLCVADGEFVVMVGPSGCGKSTLLRMIAGLESVTSGDILIDGRSVRDVAPSDRDIAMVFQNYALYPHMTVRDNLAFGLKMRKFERAEINERVSAAAEMLSLTPLLERKPKALSGGQQQRVALGRAIVRQPKLFLFDEPLSNLDAKLRVETRAELIRLHRRLRVTSLYVTHDQTEAMSMGDRIIVLKDGVVQQIGSPLDIYSNPANRFVAGFLGNPPMNFITGAIIADGPLFFASNNIRLKLTEAHNQILNSTGHSGDAGNRNIALGIRPEDVRVRHARAAETDDDDVVVGRVVYLEALGNEVLATCALDDGGGEIVARLDPRTPVKLDERIELALDMSQVKLFAANNGSRLA